MLRMLNLLLLAYLVTTWSADETVEEINQTISSNVKENNRLSQDIKEFTEAKNIEYVLENIERATALAVKYEKEEAIPAEHAEENHGKLVESLENLIVILKTPQNAHIFLNNRGVDRIITPIMGTNYEPLKKQLLTLLKALFDVTPATANVLVPMRIVDKLLDIFENDNNLALKTHALNIMYIWLPNNPKIQTRVMKLKGLEAFYDQISNLDTTATNTLLELFNKILEEHVNARDTSLEDDDYDKRRLYDKIGLVERMSTPTVCNGLLNIFKVIMSFNDNDERSPGTIMNLLNNIKPFCLKIYKRKAQAKKVFEALNSYFRDPDKVELLSKFAFNLTEVRVILGDYTMETSDNIKDEF